LTTHQLSGQAGQKHFQFSCTCCVHAGCTCVVLLWESFQVCSHPNCAFSNCKELKLVLLSLSYSGFWYSIMSVSNNPSPS